MRILSIMVVSTLALSSLYLHQLQASTVHVINNSDDMMRIFFRGLHSPEKHVEVLQAKTSGIYRVEKEKISHKPVFEAMGVSCYGGPDWQLVGTHCGTLHKDKDYTIYIENNAIGGTRTTCTELVSGA